MKQMSYREHCLSTSAFYKVVGPIYDLIYPHNRNDQKRLAKSIARFAKSTGAFRMLDVACGTGALLEYLAIMVPNGTFVGSDISWPSIQIAARNAKKQRLPVKFVSCDWLRLPTIFKEAFDCVICTGNSFTHLPSRYWKSAILGFRSLLRNNGVLVLDTYRSWTPANGTRIKIYPRGVTVSGSQYTQVTLIDEPQGTNIRKHVCFAYYNIDNHVASSPTHVETFSIQQFPLSGRKLHLLLRECGAKRVKPLAYSDALRLFTAYVASF